jgi:uncharacterized protein YndB with AHSA1/START domain
MITANQTSEALLISRTFNAPVAQVWKAFTEPAQLKKWWGPKSFTTPLAEIDLRIGGEYLSCMRSNDGKNFWGKGTYREVIPHRKLIMTDSFADERGNTVPASYYHMPGEWPLELLVTMTFEEEDGKTKFTLKHEGLPEEIKDECRQGWSESFDKLDKILHLSN